MSAPFSIVISAPPREEIDSLAGHLQSEFGAAIAVTAAAGLKHRLDQQVPDLLIIDAAMHPRLQAFELIRELRQQYPSLLILPLIPADQRNMVQQMQNLDVFLYLYTPLELAETTIAVTRASEHLRLRRHRPSARGTDSSCEFHGMIGASPTMHRLFDLIRRVAEDDDSTVLIRGESGTGKEMVAKAIHAHSRRAAKNFVPVNCAAIPDDLLESELFGYTKGAFTGATTNKIGRIQYADGGTLFLDEIGDMKPALQAKLLRVLQEKEFEPVGALKPIPVDTRVLAATHCDLEQLVSEGRFREDLYYRLSVIPLSIPPLKERREDIPLLIERFIEDFTVKRNRQPPTFSRPAMTALMHFDWRGNVRELENLIQHMSILFSGREVRFDDLPEKFHELRGLVEEKMALAFAGDAQGRSLAAGPSGLATTGLQAIADIPWHNGQVDFRELINSFETELIVHALKLTDGNKKEAARLLNLKRTTLLEKIKKKALNGQWGEVEK